MSRLTWMVVSSMERDDLWVEMTLEGEDGGEEHFADVFPTSQRGRFEIELHPRESGADWKVDLGELQRALEGARLRALKLQEPADNPA